MLELQHDSEMDWYEVRVFRGAELVGYVHGYANQGWSPQVNNIWVSTEHRRKGIATLMMSKLEDYTGQTPMPATPIDDNPAARSFWSKYSGSENGAWDEDSSEFPYVEGSEKIQYRRFVEYRQKGFKLLLLVVFEYDKGSEWFEIKVYNGPELIASSDGSANEGWHPQVNSIWVAEKHRLRGIGRHMMDTVGRYFGFSPKPTVPIEEDTVAKAFWNKIHTLKPRMYIKSYGPGILGESGSGKFRQFVEMPRDNTAELLMVDFQFDPENDWFEISVNKGKRRVAGCEGRGNEGWRPQVNNIWVHEGFRRRGIATLMLSKLERHFGFRPVPTSNFGENSPESAFWETYLNTEDHGQAKNHAVHG